MTQTISIPAAEKPAKRQRSPRPQVKKAKPDLNIVEERHQASEPRPTASRNLRPSYRPGSFGDPL